MHPNPESALDDPRCVALAAVRILAGFSTRTKAKERVMALPVLTPEQRTQALAKAAEARKKRAELKGELKSGKRTLRDVLARSGDDIVGKMKVSNVLESLPGVGKVRAQKLMEELDISVSRRVRGLGAKQREMLLEKFKK